MPDPVRNSVTAAPATLPADSARMTEVLPLRRRSQVRRSARSTGPIAGSASASSHDSSRRAIDGQPMTCEHFTRRRARPD